jgi:WXG100 family type VII secretion target
MAKAIADPAELRRFAHDLHRFNSELQGQVAAMGAKMGALQATWKDQEQQKFAEEFDQTMKVLVKFLRVSEQHVPFLVRKAERLEEYLKQR